METFLDFLFPAFYSYYFVSQLEFKESFIDKVCDYIKSEESELSPWSSYFGLVPDVDDEQTRME